MDRLLLNISPDTVPIETPEYIPSYMSCFSPALQEYIKKCLLENVRKEFEYNPPFIILRAVTHALKSIGPSIVFTRHVEIPVRLFNAHRGVSNEHYNLKELLSLPDKKNPVTRQPFMLNQIIPAPDILEQIKNRLARIESSSAPRP